MKRTYTMWRKMSRLAVEPEISEGERFVVWGYGVYGREFLQQWEEGSKRGTLVAIVDRAAENVADAPACLHMPEYLRDLPRTDIDRVVVAMIEPAFVQEVLGTLHAWHFPEDRISVLKCAGGYVRRCVPTEELGEIPDETMLEAFRTLLMPQRVRGGAEPCTFRKNKRWWLRHAG